MMAHSIRVRSACKINLTLDVLARRADGYHELDSIVHTIALWDEMTLTPGASGFTCNVPLPEENLCTKAASRWMDAQQGAASFSGIGIGLQKNLPVGAGIGAGSANAAGVLLALDEWQRRRGETPLDSGIQHNLATSLGADVPLFLRGGAQRMCGIGEQLTALAARDNWVVLLKPPVFGDTRAIFTAWGEKAAPTACCTPRMLEVWNTGGADDLAPRLGNDLAEAARRSGQPVDEVLGMLRDAGALNACLSGSGAACFGLFADEAPARQAETLLRGQIGDGWFCAAAALCGHGVEVLST